MPSIDTILQGYKAYLESAIQQVESNGQLPSRLLQDLESVSELLDGGSGSGGGGGASQAQVQAAIEAATNLASVTGKLTQILEAIDQIEPLIDNLTIESDAINLNTDGLEGKTDQLIAQVAQVGTGSDAAASTATGNASAIALIKFLNQVVTTLAGIRDTDDRAKTDVGRSEVVTGSANVVNGTPIPATSCANYAHVIVQLHGVWNGSVIFEGSNDNTNWSRLVAHSTDNSAPANQFGSPGLFSIPLGFRFFRSRFLTYNSGTAQAIAYFSGIPKSSANSNIPATLRIAGEIAHDASANATNPLVMAVAARTSNQPAVADNDVARAVGDLNGRQLVHVGNVPQVEDVAHVSIANTNETTLVSAVASVRHVLQDLVVANLDANPCTLVLRDAVSGIVRMTLVVPGQDSKIVNMHGWAARSTNAAWTVQATSATPNFTVSAKFYRLGY